ncbi:MAG: hypothetical protein ACREM1_05795, partial [Longimicrobiales bacterium]
MIANRSLKLLFIGLSALGLAGLAAGLTHEPPAPEPLAADLVAPVQPPIANREAIQRATGLSDAFIAIAETVTPAVVRIQAERSLLAAARRGNRPGWEGMFDNQELPDI